MTQILPQRLFFGFENTLQILFYKLANVAFLTSRGGWESFANFQRLDLAYDQNTSSRSARVKRTEIPECTFLLKVQCSWFTSLKFANWFPKYWLLQHFWYSMFSVRKSLQKVLFKHEREIKIDFENVTQCNKRMFVHNWFSVHSQIIIIIIWCSTIIIIKSFHYCVVLAYWLLDWKGNKLLNPG